MPKGSNQKVKLYYLAKIMIEKTDDEHSLTLPEISRYLDEYGVTADRKCLYDDLATLEVLGIDIIGQRVGKEYLYHVGQKQFEIAELKLLVDAIQSSKFITEKKSNDLIKKLTGMASEYEARELKRQVVVQGRIKTMNESIYYIVDEIHKAIANNKMIAFEYYRWTIDKKLEKRREELYEVSPWALMWDNENYYLVAYVNEEQGIKHYRVDKMRNIEILRDRRQGRDIFNDFNLAAYAKMNFGMFGGEITEVTIEFANHLVGVFLDRFGKDIPIHKANQEGWSQTWVKVAMSDQFLGWIFALGEDVRIIGSDKVVEACKKKLKGLAKNYK